MRLSRIVDYMIWVCMVILLLGKNPGVLQLGLMKVWTGLWRHTLGVCVFEEALFTVVKHRPLTIFQFFWILA